MPVPRRNADGTQTLISDRSRGGFLQYTIVTGLVFGLNLLLG